MAYNSPLSSPYGTSQLGGPPVGSGYRDTTHQPPALWYYGPSCSQYYNGTVPPRPYSSSGATDYHEPSSRHDAFHGRPHRRSTDYDPWRPWPFSRLRAYPY